MTQPIRTASFTAGDLCPDALLLGSTATDTVAAVFTDGDLLVSILTPLPRVVTITRSASAGAYTTDAITITNKDGTIATLTQTSADGGDVLRTSILLDNIKTIAFPAQVSTAGAYTIGVDDIGAPRGDQFRAVDMHADSPLRVQYGEPSASGGLAGPQDVLPYLSTLPHREINPTRVVTNTAAASATTVACTVYY